MNENTGEGNTSPYEILTLAVTAANFHGQPHGKVFEALHTEYIDTFTQLGLIQVTKSEVRNLTSDEVEALTVKAKPPCAGCGQ
jgi:hypothetical protein